jgi:hypothetical protein
MGLLPLAVLGVPVPELAKGDGVRMTVLSVVSAGTAKYDDARNTEFEVFN